MKSCFGILKLFFEDVGINLGEIRKVFFLDYL